MNDSLARQAEKKSHRKRLSRSAHVESISSAVVIKDEDLFFLCDREGRVPVQPGSGLGLYFHDCRFLNGYEMRLGGDRPTVLGADARRGYQANLAMANKAFQTPDGTNVEKEEVGVEWERLPDASRTILYDRITVHNYRLESTEVPLELLFAASFEALFEVRGTPAKKRGKLHDPEWRDGALHFRYDGADDIRRTTTVHFQPPPDETEKTTARYRLDLGARESKRIEIAVVLSETPENKDSSPKQPAFDFDRVEAGLRDSCKKWVEARTDITTSSRSLNRVLERSLHDLRMLRARIDGHDFYAAGVPWYVTLFGRDSIIAALQSLAYEPELAEQTLRLLAKFQGTKVDAWRDEGPGKIMHELRVGEMAHTGEIPQTPYYGTIDATPLFLILLAQHAAWTGSLKLFKDLRGAAEKAIRWIAEYGDPQKAGWLAYAGQSSNGLSNQGWKDSGDSIVNADGSLAEPPIALVEVQGYLYLAERGLAGLYRRSGDDDEADRLDKAADALRERFNRDFWLEDKGVFALALQRGGRPAAVVASNAGQALWSGIADPDKARRTSERLMADDMFSGWGVRTLSMQEKRYNPAGYHVGSVWPHDNSLIVAGFRNYGCDEAARRVFGGIAEAAVQFHAARLPEVFCGYTRGHFDVPVHYPVACHPQAWAAGAAPFLLVSLLGLTPEAFDGRLRVVRPVLPNGVDRVDLRRLRVGEARVDLRFTREGDQGVAVAVVKQDGRLDVVVERTGESGRSRRPASPKKARAKGQ